MATAVAFNVTLYFTHGAESALTFGGVKMLLAPIFPIATGMSLGFIVLSISLAILFSLIYSSNKSTT
jgi:hypothetical protein